MQETFERLSVLHSSKKDKADYYLTKAWESYWRRIELIDWFERIKKSKKSKGLHNMSNV